MAESSTIDNQEIERAPNTLKENSIAISIINKLDHSPQVLSNTYICKVHQELRMMNEKAYEPVLLSIGPYHYSKQASSLRYMEEHKLRYLNQVMERVESHRGISKAEQLNNYLVALKDLEDKAKACYMDAITLNEHEFIEMMLLDGCFIIELFIKWSSRNFKDRSNADPLFKVDWIINSLVRDLILIENQLPFFILEKLFCVIFDDPTSLHLISIALTFLPVYCHLPPTQNRNQLLIARQSIKKLLAGSSTSGQFSLESRVLNFRELGNTKHLLDLMHKFMLIEETIEAKPKSNREDEPVDNANGIKGSTVAKDSSRQILAYSATELSDLGVRFRGIEKGKFYDIKFEHGTLEIPTICVDDGTEVTFRNLIAYEEHAHGDSVMYIADYMIFMNSLIGSPQDVELLCRQGIFNTVGRDDEAKSTMFRQMVKRVTVPNEFYYEKIVQDLTKHCKERKHVWMGALRRNYLNSPWTVLSTIAGSILLIATLLQTIYTVLSWYHNK